MAYVYVICENYDEAVDEIEPLLASPGASSTGWFKADPLMRPLLDHPRFQTLLAKGDQVFR